MGFGGIAEGAETVAQVLFAVFAVLFLVRLVLAFMGGRAITRRTPRM
jgi:uncharacterized membrane protein YtjA (UPF0391 family)